MPQNSIEMVIYEDDVVIAISQSGETADTLPPSKWLRLRLQPL